jgi:plastocyanin
MKNIKGYGLWLFLLAFFLTACASGQTPESPQVTAPAIGVEITKDGCPSIEAQTDVQIVWTNNDNVDHTLLIEQKDEQGVVMESGGTDVFQPGDIFTIVSLAPGEYTYYCSKDRTSFGSILITQ